MMQTPSTEENPISYIKTILALDSAAPTREALRGPRRIHEPIECMGTVSEEGPCGNAPDDGGKRTGSVQLSIERASESASRWSSQNS